MKFSCDRCHTRYSIPDERVKGKVLKIRCKTCGNVITVGGRKKHELKSTDSSPARRARAVRPKASAVGLPTAGRPTDRRKTGTDQSVAGMTPKAAGAQRNVAVSRDKAAGPTDRKLTHPAQTTEEPGFGDKTVVSDPNIDMAALRAKLTGGPATVSDLSRPPSRSEPETMPGELEEWYLADDHGEYGPMTFSELAARIRRREHGPDAQVWREGFPDWMDLEAVPELRPHLKHVPPPRVRHKDDWGEAEPAAAPVKLTAPPPELEPKPQPEPEPLPAPRARPAAPLPSGKRPVPRPASEASAPPKRKQGAAAFFGKDGLDSESEEHISSPVPLVGIPEVAPAPVMVPATQPSDRNRLFAVLFAIMGAVALLALSGLVIYLLIRETGHPSSTKQPELAKNQQPAAPATVPAERSSTAPREAMAAPRQGDEGDVEMVMDPVEVSLPTHGPRARASARPKSRTSAQPRPRARSNGFGSSFSTGSFGGFGPVGISDRRGMGPGPRVRSSRPRPIRATRKVTKPEVMAVIRRHVHRLKRCYERAVRLHPTELRRAKMKVSIRISSSGRVTRVGITPGRYRGLSLGDCIVSTIRTWKFPPSTASYGTGFPLSFVGK